MPVYKVHFRGRTATGRDFRSWYPLEAPDLETALVLAEENRDMSEVVTTVKYWKES